MDANVLNVTGDSSGAQNALKGFVDSLTAANLAMDNIAKKSVTLNVETGRQVTELTKLVTAYEKVKTVEKEMADGSIQKSITTTTDNIKRQAVAARDLAKALKEATIAQNLAASKQGEQFLRAQFPVPTNATISQVVAYQNQLDKVLKMMSTGKLSVQDFNTVMNKVGSGDTNLSGFSTSMNQAYTAIQRLSGAMKEQDDIGKKLLGSANQLGLSFRNLFNIGEALVFKEVISFISGQISASVGAATKLQIRIAEIRTIAQDSGSTFKQWNDSLTGVSNKTGIDVHDIGEAAYQSLSNQTTKGAEDTGKFLETAGEFARVTMSKTSDAVGLLSSSFNTFGGNARDAEKNAAILFRTVQIGRLRIEDLANGFGRVAQPAAAMGLTLSETSAAIATLTKQGVSAHDAQTQVLNVLIALLKPTGELKQLMESWGTPTIEAANATFGFATVLEKLQAAAKGSTSELAQLFPNMRGLRGAGGLTQNGQFDKYKEDLAQIETAGSSGEYDLAKKLRAEPAADAIIKELNKVKNFFINDFGQGLLTGAKQFNDFLGDMSAKFKSVTGFSGGFASLAEVIKTLTITLFDAGIVVAGYYVYMKTANAVVAAGTLVKTLYTAATARSAAATVAESGGMGVNTTATVANTAAKTANLTVSAALSATFMTAIPVIGAVAAGLYLLHNQMKESTEDQEKYRTSVDKTVDALAKMQSKQAANVEKTSNEKFKAQSAQDFASPFARFAKDILDADNALTDFQRHSKDMSNDFDIITKDFGESLKDNMKSFTEEIDKADSAIQKVHRAVQAGAQESDELLAKFAHKNASPEQQLILDQNKINSDLAKVRAYQATGDPVEIEKGLALLREVKKEIIALEQAKLDWATRTNTQAYNDYQKTQTKQQQAANNRGITNQTYGDPHYGQAQVITDAQPFNNDAEKQLRAIDVWEKQIEVTNNKILEAKTKINQQGKLEEGDLIKKQQQFLEKELEKLTSSRGLNSKGQALPEFQKGPGDATFDTNKYNAKLNELTDALRQTILKALLLKPTLVSDSKENRDKQNRNENLRDERAIKLINALDSLKETMSKMLILEDKKNAATTSQESAINLNSRRQREFTEANSIIKDSPEKITSQLDQIGEVAKMLAKASEAIKGDIEGFGAVFGEGAKALREAIPPAKENQDLAQKYNELMNQARAAVKEGHPEQVAGILPKMTEILAKMSDNIEKLATARQHRQTGEPVTGERPHGQEQPIPDSKGLNINGVILAYNDAAKSLKELTQALQDAQNKKSTLEGTAGKGIGPIVDLEQGEKTAKIMNDFILQAVTSPESGIVKFNLALQDLAKAMSILKGPTTNVTPSTPSPFTPQSNAEGGIISGGPPGTDTVLSWLDNGEYVMPRQRTQQYLPLLKAMHMGQLMPRGNGSNVSTVVGDINITVQGGDTTQKTVREIGESLRREIRRGNVVLH